MVVKTDHENRLYNFQQRNTWLLTYPPLSVCPFFEPVSHFFLVLLFFFSFFFFLNTPSSLSLSTHTHRSSCSSSNGSATSSPPLVSSSFHSAPTTFLFLSFSCCKTAIRIREHRLPHSSQWLNHRPTHTSRDSPCFWTWTHHLTQPRHRIWQGWLADQGYTTDNKEHLAWVCRTCSSKTGSGPALHRTREIRNKERAKTDRKGHRYMYGVRSEYDDDALA